MGMTVPQLQRRVNELERLVKALMQPKSKAQLIASGEALVCKTPGGGIAARSGTTVSSATCTVWKRTGTTLSATTSTVTVYNLSPTAVAATVEIVAVPTNIGLVAVWEDC